MALDELRLAIQSARQHQEVRYKTVKERDYAREQAQEYSRMLRHARKQLELAGQRRRQDAAAVLRSAAIGSGGPSGPTASLPSSKPLTTISDQQLLPPLATSDASTSFSRGSFKS